MTREESIKKLEHYRYCLNFQYGWYGKDDDEALDMAIKALEQQPTDVVDRVTIKEYLDSFGKDTNVTATDCVKREDVENAIYDYSRSCDVNYEQIMEFIDKLPSVTPQQKIGRWIEHIHNGMHYIECPKCSSWFLRMYLTRNSYCPNCGAKMQDVEE